MRRRPFRAPRINLPGEPLRDGPTLLRPWRDSDQQALVEACRDPEIVRWTRVPDNYGPTDAKAYLLGRWDMLSAGLAAPFAIVAASDGQLLGSVSLLRIAWEHRRAEVGYWLGARGRGDGHATRAVRLISAWGFASLDLERIDLLASAANHASQRVAERAGFTYELLLRSYMAIGDVRHDVTAYALLRD